MKRHDPDEPLTREDFESQEEYEEYLAIENDDRPFEEADPQVLQQLQAAASAYLRNERERISLSVPKRNLSQLKARALEQGMPYQTLINSILHQWLAGTNEASTIAPPSRSAEGKTKETVNQ